MDKNTHAHKNNIRRPKLASGKKMVWLALVDPFIGQSYDYHVFSFTVGIGEYPVDDASHNGLP